MKFIKNNIFIYDFYADILASRYNLTKDKCCNYKKSRISK